MQLIIINVVNALHRVYSSPAVNFVVLREIIRRLGAQYSRLSPKWCMFLYSSFRSLLQLIRVPQIL